MRIEKPDTKPDFSPVADKGELITLMEPLVLSSAYPRRSELTDLCFDLVAKSSSLRSGLPSGVLTALSELVRKMNCYYSNLIEGHDTHPIDIERAMNDDYSHDKKKRDLQLEAKAHVIVQEWIDSGGVSGRSATREAILEIHERICANLPEDLEARAVLEAVLYRGELPRADIPGIVGLGERQARRIVSGLIQRGVLVAASDRAPLRLAFPAKLASRWMPGLFPDVQSN